MGFKDYSRGGGSYVRRGARAFEDFAEDVAESHPIERLKEFAYRHEVHPVLAVRRLLSKGSLGDESDPSVEQLINAIYDALLNTAIRTTNHVKEWQFRNLVVVTINQATWDAVYDKGQREYAQAIERAVRLRLQRKFGITDSNVHIRLRSEINAGGVAKGPKAVMRPGEFLVEARSSDDVESFTGTAVPVAAKAEAQATVQDDARSGNQSAAAQSAPAQPTEADSDTTQAFGEETINLKHFDDEDDQDRTVPYPGGASAVSRSSRGAAPVAKIIHDGTSYVVRDGSTFGVDRPGGDPASIVLPQTDDLFYASRITGEFTFGDKGWTYVQRGRNGAVVDGESRSVQLAAGESAPIASGDVIYVFDNRKGKVRRGITFEADEPTGTPVPTSPVPAASTTPAASAQAPISSQTPKMTGVPTRPSVGRR